MSYTPKQDSDVDCLHWHALNYRTAGLDAQSAWVELEAFFDKQIKEAYQAGRASRDAEVEALRADAGRYRWLLRNQLEKDSNFGKPFLVLQFEADGHDLDQAIDAARKEK